MNRLCYVGRNIWVGSQAMCDHRPRKFTSVLHIVSVGQSPCASVGPVDLVETMTEKIPLGLERIERIAGWASSPANSPILIHCGAGMCRSPTVAIVALVARGEQPGLAMGAIADAMWRQYIEDPITPWWEHAVMQEIFWWTRQTATAK